MSPSSPAKFADDVQPFLRDRTGTVHDEMGIGNALVNFLDAFDCENIAGGLACEFIGPVRSSDSDGQGIDAGLLDEVGCLLRICQ